MRDRAMDVADDLRVGYGAECAVPFVHLRNRAGAETMVKVRADRNVALAGKAQRVFVVPVVPVRSVMERTTAGCGPGVIGRARYAPIWSPLAPVIEIASATTESN